MRRLFLILIGSMGLISSAYAEGYSNFLKSCVFDPATITTVNGEIVEVDKFLHPSGGSPDIYMMLGIEGRLVTVLLGPQWYIKEIGLDLEEGKMIQVQGSTQIVDAQRVIMATSVKDGEMAYIFRDSQGNPAWENMPPPD